MSLQVDTHNENSSLLVLFSLLLFLCSSLPTTKADPLYTICLTSPNYTVNSAFELNLKQLLQSLPSSTSLSGFYNTSVASGSKDPVFGLGLCRGDISSVDCRSCIRNAILGIVRNCSNGKDATIFYELCQVRYSYNNFFSKEVYDGKYPNWTTSKQNELRPEQFKMVLKGLLENISQAASESSNSLFATGETSLTKTNMLYGLAQCTKDIARDQCRSCLTSLASDLVGCCSDYTGGFVVSNSCNLRFELYRFYRVVQVAGRPPTPSKSTNMLYAGKYLNWTTSKQHELGPEQFTRILKGLLEDISSQAAFDPSNSLFAARETSLTKSNMLYGLAQCTKDIARELCYTCLTSLVSDLVGYCSSYTGGFIVSYSCNIRFELYRFYRVAQVADRPPTPPSKSTRSSVFIPSGENRRKRKRIVGIRTAVAILAVAALLGSCLCYLGRRSKGTQRDDGETRQHERGLLNDIGSVEFPSRNMQTQDDKNQMDNKDLPLMEFSTVKEATDDFSDSNKLGQGGFGIVYKGKLLDGNEIAVKRLSRKSWQGLGEFKNEIILIARLQHGNLVRLLGCSIEGEEKLLIYEFMPNKSLDLFLFDQERRSKLGWETRFNIINGIARGLLYLHENSTLKIIHRDLKPNNVLLDHEMNAKISDFGMARIFGENQSQANTKRVVGTCGYMPPEFAVERLFSVKSDVYSFGVVLLEILSGKRSNGFYLSEHAQSLLAYAWHLWKERRSLDFIDSLLIKSYPTEEVLRCLHIGLLCVQENAADRPTMSSVVVMLGSTQSINLPQPTHPALAVGRVTTDEASIVSIV